MQLTECLMRRTLDGLFNEPDPDRRRAMLPELFCEDGSFHDPRGSYTGHAAIERAVTTLREAFPGWSFRASTLAGIAGDAGTLSWSFGPPEDPARLRGVDLARLRDGRIHALFAIELPVTEAARLATELLAALGRGDDPDQVAQLFSEDAEIDVPGDVGALPWIGRGTGRAAFAAFVRESRVHVTLMELRVEAVLSSDTQAVVLAHLESTSKATGRTVRQAVAMELTVAAGHITRYRLLEDSYQVSRAARGT